LVDFTKLTNYVKNTALSWPQQMANVLNEIHILNIYLDVKKIH